MNLSASVNIFVHQLNVKTAVQHTEVCCWHCFSHFIAKDADESCSVILEDRSIITQEGKLQDALYNLLQSY